MTATTATQIAIAARHAERDCTPHAATAISVPADALAAREVALVDLIDRLLANGLVLTGDLILSIAEVDLVHISLRALVTSITGGERAP